MTGDAWFDVRQSGGGNDHIEGGGGIWGDADNMHDNTIGGNDEIYSLEGNNNVYGDARVLFDSARGGNDFISGGTGDDELKGGGLFGSAQGGNDRVQGDRGTTCCSGMRKSSSREPEAAPTASTGGPTNRHPLW